MQKHHGSLRGFLFFLRSKSSSRVFMLLDYWKRVEKLKVQKKRQPNGHNANVAN